MSYNALMKALEAATSGDMQKMLVDYERIMNAYVAHREADGIWLEKICCAGDDDCLKHKGKCYRLPQEDSDELAD